jgi:hypothetical protein
VPNGVPVVAIFIVFVFASLANAWFFFSSDNYNLKRRLWPWSLTFGGALFLAFGVALGFGGLYLAVMIPTVAIMSLLNYRRIWFCPSCGATVWSTNLVGPAKFCSQCGVARPE